MANKRIPQLPPKTTRAGTMEVAIYDYATDTTYRMALDVLAPVTETLPDAWDETIPYSIGDIVSFEDAAYISNTNANEGNIPSSSPSDWTPVDQSQSSSLAYWAPGIYTADVVTVLYDNGTNIGLYILVDPARPYNSTNFATELAAGDWELIAGGGGGSDGNAESIEGVYANIAAMLADQTNQRENAFYYVTTATTDPTVSSGWAIYRKLAASTANLADYIKVMEQESLDLVIADASETVKGIAELADQTEAEVGGDNTATGSTDHTRIMTPRGFKHAFNKALTVVKAITAAWTALTAARGTNTIQIATTAFVQQEIDEPVVDLGTVSSGTITLDLSRKNYMVTLTGTVTFDHSNLVAGREYKLWVQRATNTTVNWTASKWKAPLGQTPSFTNPTTNGVGTAVDCLTFVSRGVDGRPTIVITPDSQNI